jgi:ABC-type glycerol-3-phosphate transport system permease component
VALLAGYAFAKFSFRGRNLLFGAFLVTIVIPAQVTLVPSFLVVVDLRPLITLQGTENLTLPVALSSMQSSGIFEYPWGPIMAIAFLSLLPLLVVFLLFQRTFVQGIASTGMK